MHGIVRRSSSFNTGRIDHLYKDRHETGVKLFLHYGDLCDATNLITIIAKVKPTFNMRVRLKLCVATKEFTNFLGWAHFIDWYSFLDQIWETIEFYFGLITFLSKPEDKSKINLKLGLLLFKNSNFLGCVVVIVTHSLIKVESNIVDLRIL